MTSLEAIVETYKGLLAQVCLSALLAIVGVFAIATIFKSTRAAFSGIWRKSRFAFAAVSILSLSMALWGNKTNLLRRIIHPVIPPVVTVSEEDIQRGFRLEGIVTNETPFCEMPTNAVEYTPWRLRGGRETDGNYVIVQLWNCVNAGIRD